VQEPTRRDADAPVTQTTETSTSEGVRLGPAAVIANNTPARGGEASADYWQQLETVVRDHTESPLTVHGGRIDLAPTNARFKEVVSRIEAARTAIRRLILACESGNRQHAALGEYAEEYRATLDDLKPEDPGITWYVTAQMVENYRSNYVALSKQQPGEYPPLDAALSTQIDAVVLASGILARLFPEIAKSQDDFEKYSGRQVGVRRATRELLDHALSDLAAAENALSPRAAAVAKAVADLHPGATPDDAPEVARTVATKSGFLRGSMVAIAKFVLEQAGYLRENIRSKGSYDISKEIIKKLVEIGSVGILGYMSATAQNLTSLAAQWPAMFDFIAPLLRLLGLM